jgi:hypothetical protein
MAVGGEELAQRGRRVDAGEPQARTARVGGDELDLGVARERDPLAGRRAAERAGAVGRAQLDDPPAAVQLEVGRRGGEAQLDRLAAGERPGHRRGQRRGDVDHEQVAGAQVLRQVAEAGVLERARRPLRDQQAHLVAGEAARLGRRGRLARPRQLERARHHAAAPVAAARSSPAAARSAAR